MREVKFLKPGENIKVRKPDGSHLHADGEAIEMTSYWLRKESAGDVVSGAEPQKSEPKGARSSNDKRE